MKVPKICIDIFVRVATVYLSFYQGLDIFDFTINENLKETNISKDFCVIIQAKVYIRLFV